MIAPAVLIEQARQWCDPKVKFLHQGRTRHGADCLGFIGAVLGELGSQVLLEYLPTNYPRAPQSLVLEGLTALSREIPLQPGALIAFRWPRDAHPSHAAIYTGLNMIHCFQREGGVIEHGYRAAWPKIAVGIWALPEVTYACEGDSLAI